MLRGLRASWTAVGCVEGARAEAFAADGYRGQGCCVWYSAVSLGIKVWICHKFSKGSNGRACGLYGTGLFFSYTRLWLHGQGMML